MMTLRTIVLALGIASVALLSSGCSGYWKEVTPNLEPHIDAVFKSGEVTRCYVEKRQNVLRCEITQVTAEGTREYYVASVHAKAKKDFFAYLDENGVSYEFVDRE